MFFKGLLEFTECGQQPLGLACVDTQLFKRFYALFLAAYAFSGCNEVARCHGEHFVHVRKRGTGGHSCGEECVNVADKWGRSRVPTFDWWSWGGGGKLRLMSELDYRVWYQGGLWFWDVYGSAITPLAQGAALSSAAARAEAMTYAMRASESDSSARESCRLARETARKALANAHERHNTFRQRIPELAARA